MKTKAFRRYYWIVTIALIGFAAVPVWNFAVMTANAFPYYFSGSFWSPLNYDAFLVIPFMAVTVATLAGFLLMPLLRNMALYKKHILVSAVAALIFLVLEICAEKIAAGSVMRVLMRRIMPIPDNTAATIMWGYLPLSVRIHYYIFSIVLILAVLNWLYNLTETLFGTGKPGKKFVVAQGCITLCYVLAYVFVRAVQYDSYGAMRLTRESVVNAAVCFILAALAVGFAVGSASRGKIIPPLLAVTTVLALYGAEYALLSGGFYSYGENAVMTGLLRGLIIGIPGLLVFLLLRVLLKGR